MKRTVSLNFILGFAIWGAFKAAESLLRTAGSRDIYVSYNIEFIYYALVVFSAIGGIALAYSILKAKPWGYTLGFVWFGVDIVHVIFTTIVSYLDKPLMIEILSATAISRGRDAEGIAAFVESSAYGTTTLVTGVVLIAISIFLIWRLYVNRAYFGKAV